LTGKHSVVRQTKYITLKADKYFPLSADLQGNQNKVESLTDF
jgi:hypothetical protein